MKRISCNDVEFKQIKDGIQLYKIFNENETFDFLEEIELLNSKNEKIVIQITSYNTYTSIDNVLKIVSYKQFGDYKSESKFKDYVSENYEIKDKVVVCRVKYSDTKQLNILDDKLADLLDNNSVEKFNLGLSGSQVYSVKLKNGIIALLKMQRKVGADTLKEEYDALEFLYNNVKVPKTFYYNEIDNVEYLLRECVDGTPLYEKKGFGYKLGKEVKKFHELYSKDLKFNKFTTDIILNNMLNKIDVIYENRSERFKNYSKEELIEFLKENKPEDDALIHGDLSLTNILVDDNDEYCFIDLGNISVSTKYFDIYVLIKSLKINKLEEEYEDFLRGYGLENIEEKYLDWMYFVEKSYN